ncbi:MAG: twin-arginine translocase TatA/TatE family subunit [Bradymonadales bacterium]|nr:MAG: twin-arginine translocase TatA/TatE family subunit [Bradymonadales bacterium]
MFGLGTTELLILAAVVVLLFGASKLPQLGAGLGQGIRNFKKSLKDKDAIDITPEDEKKNEKNGQSNDKNSD